MRRSRTAKAAAGLAGALALAGAAPPLAVAPAATVSQKEVAVRWALSQVGTREIGETDCGEKVERWQRRAGWRLPPCREWCGAFVHEAWLQAGIDLRNHFLFPERVLDDALAGRRGLRAIPVRSVRRGDMVIYAWGNGKRANHFGLVLGPYARGSGVVRTVEGNSSQAVGIYDRPLRFAVTGVRVLAGE